MKSKHLVLPILVTSFTFLVSTPILAQTNTPKVGIFRQAHETITQNRQEIKEIRQENQELRQGMRASITGKPNKTEIQRQLITNNQNGLYNSLTVRFTNLEKYQLLISDRATKKLTKFPSNSDILAAQARLASSDLVALKKTYSDDLAKYQASISSLKTSTDPKLLRSELKTAAKQVNSDLKAIRNYLVDTLRLIVKAK